MLAVLALLADNAGLTPVEPRSPNAEGINDSWNLILALTGAIFLIVEAALVVFIVRYRRRRRERDDEGPQIRGHTRLELIWTVVPLILLFGIMGFVFFKLPQIEDVPAGDRLEVEVEGRQFYWRYTYPNGKVAYDTLRVPTNRNVVLRITSPNHDVIHSWWIPALGGKMDAIPRYANETWFNVDRPGVYTGNCTEFCGVQHGAMTAQVDALDPAEFVDWVVDPSPPDGEQIFLAACAKCHNVDGTDFIGTSIRGNPILTDKQQLRELIENGQAAMPAVGRGWSDAEIDSLFEYVRELGSANGS